MGSRAGWQTRSQHRPIRRCRRVIPFSNSMGGHCPSRSTDLGAASVMWRCKMAASSPFLHWDRSFFVGGFQGRTGAAAILARHRRPNPMAASILSSNAPVLLKRYYRRGHHRSGAVGYDHDGCACLRPKDQIARQPLARIPQTQRPWLHAIRGVLGTFAASHLQR
jgi:hypothetical protein